MSVLKTVVSLLFVFIVSTKGFPSRKETGKVSKNIGTASDHHFRSGVRLPLLVTTMAAHPLSMKTEDESPPRMSIKDKLLPSSLLVKDEPPRRTEMEDSPTRIVPAKGELPPRILLDGRPQTRTLTKRTNDVNAIRFRNKRAVIWRAPPIRIPSITRLIRPAVPAPRPSGVGSPSASLPKPGPIASGSLAPKGGPKAGLFGAGSSPVEDNKPRPMAGSKSGSIGADLPPPKDNKSSKKGGSKSGGSGSFPDFGDLPSPDGWNFPSFSGSDSPAGGNPVSGISEKEDDTSNKTTTEKSRMKWERNHFDHGEYFPDYDYHGWHQW